MSEIEVLDGIEAVRKRPGMYVGDVRDGSGLHHLLWEVVGNALDEHLRGRATRLEVRIDGNTATVADDGYGIPVHERPDGRTYLETMLTTLHCGATADDHFPHVHITVDLHGLGLAPVCALSAELIADVRHGGRRYRQSYSRGRAVALLTVVGPCAESGTSIRFTPDPEIFSVREFDEALIRSRLQELAYLNPGLAVTFQGIQLPGGDGLGTYCRELCGSRPLLAPHPLRLRGRHKKVDVDVAVCWTPGNDLVLKSYVSQGPTKDGGSHERGFWEGLRRGFAEVDAAGVLPGMSTDRFRQGAGAGLVAVVHAGLYDPTFDSPTKSRLRSPEGRSAVAHVVCGGVAVYLAQYHRLRETIFSRLGSEQ